MIERLFENDQVVAVNVQRQDDGYQVHLRRAGEGFRCAQQFHATIKDAIAEHLSKVDLGDLLS